MQPHRETRNGSSRNAAQRLWLSLWPSPVHVCACAWGLCRMYLGRQQLPVRVAPYDNVGSVNNFGIKPPTRMSKNITVPGTARVQMRQQRAGVDC